MEFTNDLKLKSAEPKDNSNFSEIFDKSFGYLAEDLQDQQKMYQDVDTFNNVINIGKAIANSKTPDAVIAAFDRDPNFHKAFNSNGKYALENIAAYLEVSNENMVADFWRYCNACSDKLEQVRNALTGKTVQENFTERRAYSLVDYSLFYPALNRIQKIYNVMVKFAEDTGKVTEEQLYKALEAAGVQWNVNGKGEKVTPETIGDPNDPSMAQFAVISGVFGSVVNGVTGAIVNRKVQQGSMSLITGTAIRTAVGGIVGLGGWLLLAVAHGLYHKNNRPIGQRGWNRNNLEKAVKDMIAFIDKNKAIKLPKELGFFRSLFNKERRHKRKIFKLVTGALGVSMRIMATGLWEAVM